MVIQSIFLTATDTGVGKTYFSIKIIQDLIDSGAYARDQIAYYKPIQCGSELTQEGLETDFNKVAKATGVDVYNTYFLKHPASPHYAAELEGVEISLEKILADFNSIKNMNLPAKAHIQGLRSDDERSLLSVNELRRSERNAVEESSRVNSKYRFVLVEGAGGIAVPLNKCELVSDLVVKLDLPLVIVTRPDLGTINHSLITLGHAKKKNLEILGLLVSEPSQTGEQYSINDAEFLIKQRENSIKTICEMMDVRLLNVASLAVIARSETTWQSRK